jgi:hypothetical protein
VSVGRFGDEIVRLRDRDGDGMVPPLLRCENCEKLEIEVWPMK